MASLFFFFFFYTYQYSMDIHSWEMKFIVGFYRRLDTQSEITDVQWWTRRIINSYLDIVL